MKRIVFLLLTLTWYCGNDGTTSSTDTTDYDLVVEAHNDLTYADIIFSGVDNKSSTTLNFTLPLTGTNDTTISWESDQANIIIVDDQATVTRPAFGSGNQLVILTAKIVKGTASLGKQFILIVIETEPVAGNTVAYLISASFTMVFVEAKSTFTAMDDSGTVTIVSSYFVGEKEITYLQWLEVKIWADANGYSFSHMGVMGDGIGDNNQHPVTTINWRDALVWTNALTEYYNAQKGTSYKCVYTSDASFNNCIKTSNDNAAIVLTAGSVDNPYVNTASKGFRLLTRDEWELAARYIVDSNVDGDIKDSGEYYPGNHISGDTSADYTASSVIGNYAWYFTNSGNSTSGIGLKLTTALGLYDMTGNVFEWTFDWDVSNVNVYRVYRGGSWNLTAVNLQIGKVNYNSPDMESTVIGFRLGQSY